MSAVVRDRFDGITRMSHWATTVLVLTLTLTGTILYVGQLSSYIGRREVLRDLHVVSGLLLPLPLMVGVLGGRQLRADLVELVRWTPSDRDWFRRWSRRSVGRDPRARFSGRFNGGQKLVAALFGAGLAVQLLTGSVMTWAERFPVDWRTGATFVHDWTYLALVALVAGHVWQALAHPELLRAMLRGGAGPGTPLE